MPLKAAVGQVSAIERLQSLPGLFLGSELTRRFEWTSRTASQYLFLWKRRGLVEALGGHSDVFANLLVDRNPDWFRALKMAMPSAVIIGVEALRQAGWTTQIPARPSVAVLRTQRVFKIERFDVVPRGVRWFKALDEPGAVVGHPRQGLIRLSPAWALADLFREESWGAFGLWPDDIEWDRVTVSDCDAWRRAVSAFALDLPELSDMGNFESQPPSV